jgi:tetratricopeptide (TPR) repeat protein
MRRLITKLPTGWGRLVAILVFAAGGEAHPGARADEITYEGRTLHRAQIVDYADGEIEVRTETGEYDHLPLDAVEFIVLDSVSGVADFNQAEELLVQNKAGRAVERYERAVRSARGFWATIARVRLVMAADASGNLDRAVRAWTELVDEDLVTAARLIPQSAIAQRERANRRTIIRLAKVIAAHDGGAARHLLELMHCELLRRVGSPDLAECARAVARQPLPPRIISERSVAIWLAAVSTGLTNANRDETLAALDDMLADAPGPYLPDVLLAKARVLLATARSEREYFDAALPAMRVVVHFPKTIQAGDGLLLAAEAHEAAGQVPAARRLLRECLARDTVPERVRVQAREALVRLGQPDDGK